MSTQPLSRRPVFAAVVLGTALSGLGMEMPAPRSQAVNDIGRYCTSCWRNARLPADSWGDCTQEVFARLLQNVPAARWPLALKTEGDERREFLRAIDAVKKRTQRQKRHSDGVELAADRRSDPDRQLTEDREAVRLAAERVLSDRQRRIVELSFEGHTVNDIGQSLGLPVQRISDEKYKALRKLENYLAGRRDELEFGPAVAASETPAPASPARRVG